MAFLSNRYSTRIQSSRKPLSAALQLETLEDRTVPATFSVINLNNSGIGSFRQALLDANTSPGADTINFSVAGTIKLTTFALPTVTGQVDIDGTTATGFAGTPAVEIDFNRFGGLQFVNGSTGSAVRSLALVNSSNAGLKINGGGYMVVVGNYIGVQLDGSTVSGNVGNGIELLSTTNNTIGGINDQDRNVIAGNYGNGILVSRSLRNQIANNFIGTDATGTIDLGNKGNGILLTDRALGNLLGGSETGGNDPTMGVYVRPPLGNLISGNQLNGVLVTGQSQQTKLSGNFIGTDISGIAPLGNELDGVAIVSADNNSLIGCTINDNPFIYFNVVGGNKGNGLRVNNSNNTTIQANFFGLGSDNQTPVGNQLNGVVVEGTSRKTVFGGVIPLGNVVAANHQNGILIQGTASGFQSFNTFSGVAAFQDYDNLGNHWNGLKITSTGGGNEVRTSVFSSNGRNGIEVSGDARGVLIAENIIGMNTSGEFAIANHGNGILVAGTAHDVLIGGKLPSFSVIPHNLISGNLGHGVAVTGKTYNVVINYSFIGTNVRGDAGFGNALDGVYVGPGTRATTIGSNNPALITVISGNGGHGVELVGTTGNSVINTYIGTDKDGDQPIGNGGDGIFINNSSNNLIGSTVTVSNGRLFTSGLANRIAYNGGDGVHVASGISNGIHGNAIYGNALLGIALGAGANKNQPAPVLTSVQSSALAVQLKGSLTSKPNSTFVLEFYASDDNVPSGRYYMGAITVKTNKSGFASFTFNAEVPPNGAQFYTATATDSANNTSTFSSVVS